MTDDRPKDLEAEKAVLGALLVSPGTWADVATRLRADDFFRAGHRDAYVAISALLSRGVAADVVTLAAELGPKLEDAGGRAYLAVHESVEEALNRGAERAGGLPAPHPRTAAPERGRPERSAE